MDSWKIEKAVCCPSSIIRRLFHALLHNWTSLSASSLLDFKKSTVIVHDYRFFAKINNNRINRHWYSGFHCRFISVSVLAKNRHWYYHCRFVAWTGSDVLKKNFISFSYNVRLRRTLYQSCSTRRDLPLCSLKSFKLRSFGCPNIFFWNHLSNKNYIWFLKLKIWIFQMTSDGETTKTKVVDLEKLSNFVVDNFFHLKSFI